MQNNLIILFNFWVCSLHIYKLKVIFRDVNGNNSGDGEEINPPPQFLNFKYGVILGNSIDQINFLTLM